MLIDITKHIRRAFNYLFTTDIRFKMAVVKPSPTLPIQALLFLLILASLVYSQEVQDTNKDLSKTIDTIIGIDLRTGRPTRESIVPRTRHTTRQKVKMARSDKRSESPPTTFLQSDKNHEVRIEDFLTLKQEETNLHPVSYIAI